MPKTIHIEDIRGNKKSSEKKIQMDGRRPKWIE